MLSIILPLLQAIGLQRVFRYVLLCDHPVKQRIDSLKRFIIAGRRSIRDSGKIPQRILFQWFIGNAVLAMLQKIRKAIPIVPHRQFPGVLRLLYKNFSFKFSKVGTFSHTVRILIVCPPNLQTFVPKRSNSEKPGTQNLIFKTF